MELVGGGEGGSRGGGAGGGGRGKEGEGRTGSCGLRINEINVILSISVTLSEKHPPRPPPSRTHNLSPARCFC